AAPAPPRPPGVHRPGARRGAVHPGRAVPAGGWGMGAAQQRGPGRPAEAAFLAPLAERARRGDVLVRRDPDPRDPRLPDRGGESVRRSAVLLHLAGTGL